MGKLLNLSGPRFPYLRKERTTVIVRGNGYKCNWKTWSLVTVTSGISDLQDLLLAWPSQRTWLERAGCGGGRKAVTSSWSQSCLNMQTPPPSLLSTSNATHRVGCSDTLCVSIQECCLPLLCTSNQVSPLNMSSSGNSTPWGPAQTHLLHPFRQGLPGTPLNSPLT